MGRQRRWIGIVGVLGLLTLGLAERAWACNNPAIGSSAEVTGPVGPGQPVPFDFTGMDGTALYTVSVNGQVVASGQASGATVSSSFVMPNLGNQAQPVNIDGSVTDPGVPSQAGQTFPSSVTIRYAPPVAPASSNPTPQTTPASQPSSPSSAASPAPAASAPGTSQPGAGSTHPIKPRPRVGSGHGGRSHGVSGQETQPGAGLSVQSSRSLTAKTTLPTAASHISPSPRPETSQRAIPTAVTSAPVPRASSAPVARPATLRARSARRPAHAPARPRTVLPRALPAAPSAGLSAPSRGAAGHSAVKRDGTPPLTVVAGLLLALLALGASGAAAAIVLARRRPQHPPKLVIADGEEIAPPSEADLLLQGLDMDAELERLLAQDDAGRAPVPAEPAHPR